MTWEMGATPCWPPSRGSGSGRRSGPPGRAASSTEVKDARGALATLLAVAGPGALVDGDRLDFGDVPPGAIARPCCRLIPDARRAAAPPRMLLARERAKGLMHEPERLAVRVHLTLEIEVLRLVQHATGFA
jgi:hypothetical protein